MSYREKCAAALELVPESKLGYLFAYIQGLISLNSSYGTFGIFATFKQYTVKC